MGNSITSKLLTPESSVFLFILLYFIAACIAFIEVPITEEIVTQTARKSGSAKGHKFILAVVACMAVGGGVYSITTDAEKVDATRMAYNTEESSFEDLKQGLISIRNAARANATTQAERSQANADYFKALADLKKEQAEHQTTRPAEAIKTGSFFHWLWAIGFSLLCSIGVIIITAYLTKYHKPLTEIPRVFFKIREDQDWAMSADDVRVIPAAVDLSGGASSVAARKAIKGRPSQSKPEDITSSKGGDSKNHPHGLDSSSGRNNSIRERSQNDGAEIVVKVVYSQDHYVAIKREVVAGNIKPIQKAVKTHLVKLNVLFVDDAARQKKAVDILDKLAGESVIINNPEFGKSGRMVAMYILNSDYSEGDEKQKEESSSDDLELVCPKCKQTELIERSVVAKSGGKVRSVCGHVYKVNSSHWKVSPVIGAGIGISEDGINPVAGIGAIISK